MKQIPLIRGLFLVLIVSWFLMPQLVHADIDWTIKRHLNLEAPPLDIATTPDGQWIFILTPGEILVYSISENKVMNRIPVDKACDRLTHSARDNTLIVTSGSKKTLKMIQLERVQKIVISGLPLQGPEHAPVTIAVFSDYQ